MLPVRSEQPLNCSRLRLVWQQPANNVQKCKQDAPKCKRPWKQFSTSTHRRIPRRGRATNGIVLRISQWPLDRPGLPPPRPCASTAGGTGLPSGEARRSRPTDLVTARQLCSPEDGPHTLPERSTVSCSVPHQAERCFHRLPTDPDQPVERLTHVKDEEYAASDRDGAEDHERICRGIAWCE